MADHHDPHEHDFPLGHEPEHDDPLHAPVGAPINEEELDPASRSLNEALKISFGVLKWIMILILVFFAFSGLREVKEGRVAVRVHLGAVTGAGSARILQPGWHLAWPEPIDQIILVPTGVQQVNIPDAFWFNVRQADRLKPIDELPVPSGGLKPGRDGSLLTSDQNLVHGRWAITFQIRAADAVPFVANVAMDRPNGDDLENAHRLVRALAERAIVRQIALTNADDFVRSRIDRAAIRRRMQHSLDRMNSGITINEVLLSEAVPPLKVRDDFRALSEAESDKAQAIENAQKQRRQILTAVAGSAHEALVFAIDQYERARRGGDPARVARAEQAINALMAGLPAATALAPLAAEPGMNPQKLASLMTAEVVTGEVPAMINDAVSYKTAVKAAVQGEAKAFLGYYEKFKGSEQLERITRDRVWQDTFQAVLGGDVETFYLPEDPNKRLYLEMNRDSEVRRARERKAQEQRARQAVELD